MTLKNDQINNSLTKNTIDNPKGLGSFFIITFLLSWLAWLPGVLLTHQWIEGSEFIIQLDKIGKWIGGLSPSLVAFFLIYREKGRNGIKALLSGVFRLKLGRWYFAIFLILPVAVVLAHSINALRGHPFPNTAILGEPWMIIPLFILFLILVAGEEFGWRGFALDKLQTKWNALNSSLILGSIWVIWHVPMFLSKGFGHHDLQLPFFQFFITLVLVSVLITWIQNNTGSLVPAFILHAFINLSGEVLPLVDKNPDSQNNYSQWIIVNVLLTLVVILVLKYWGLKTLIRDHKN